MAKEEQFEDIDPEDEVAAARYEITSYGADYTVDRLVTRLISSDIVIPSVHDGVSKPPSKRPSKSAVADFQRGFVWTKRQSDRFIESLLLGFPVPGIFLYRDDDNRMLVMDGQQRLRTLRSFYEGVLGKSQYSLEHVHQQYQGLTYKTLDPEDRRKLDDSVIHATVIRQDIPEASHASVYLIFERLNTGGTALRPQEIRAALYHGTFATLLGDLNNEVSWRKLVGPKSKFLKDQELILRCLAMTFSRETYRRPMKSFLNDFMSLHRRASPRQRAMFGETFRDTVNTIFKHLGERAFRPKTTVNAAVVDSCFVGIASALNSGRSLSSSKARKAFDALLRDEDYLSAVSRSTADEEQVKTRIEKSVRAFS
ncbi:MAG: DUF262 domain-containing protein [Myxococcota bacterium]|jgi:hypothetical protein|nr:DUF262 domain-containing protein [Myxococcota bacterium]